MAEKTTTPETPEQDNQAPVGPHPLDRRNAAFRGAEEARHELLQEEGYNLPEFSEGDPSPASSSDASGDAEAAATAAASSTDQPTAATEEPEPESSAGAEPSAEPEPGTATHTITVDGQQRQVTTEELIRSYSLESAARNRFDTANRMLKSIEALQERVARGEPDTDPSTTATPSAPAEPAALGIPREDLKKVVQAFQTGDADEATTLFEDALRRASSPLKGATPDVATLIKSATDRAVWQVNWDSAMKRFDDEYKDILSDKTLALNTGTYLHGLVEARYKEAREQNLPAPDLYDIFKEAGNTARDWVARQAERLGFKKDSSNERPSTEDPEKPGPAIVVDASTRTTMKRTSPQLSGSRAPARRLNDTPAVEPSVSIESQRSKELADLVNSRGGRRLQ